MLLKSFHPSIMHYCSMHVINLGLLYVVNGSTLKLVTQRSFSKGPGSG